MAPSQTIALLVGVAVLLVMAGEAVLSAHNEASLRARGAIEPPDDVYRSMRVAYPGAFILMAIEGGLTGPASRDMMAAGLALLGLAKALKIWAITTLGPRWTFRVLVIPNAPLVTGGPYRLMRHPNYLAVIGELVSVALIVRAPVTGLIATAGFGYLIVRRMAIEDRALGRR